MAEACCPAIASQAAFEPALFNTLRYAALHAVGRTVRYLPCQDDIPGCHGVFQATEVRSGHYASPGRGTFGGFDVAEGTTSRDLAAFVRHVETALRRAGARAIEIAQPPMCHAPTQAAQMLALLSGLGWIVTRQELNQHLPVDGRPFVELGVHAARKRLGKAARLGVTAHLLDHARYRCAYGVVQENRQKKGRTLSMPWNDVAALAAAFPGRVHMFSADQAGDMIAAAICVAVTRRVLYVYAWGERPGAEPASPVTLLAERIHAFAAQHGFVLLDLGTSSVDGVVNPGLHAFKRSLGAKSSLKLWFTRTLVP